MEPLLFKQIPRRQSDQDFFVASISKAKSMLGWEPRISVKKGVQEMLDWTSSLI